MEYLAVLGYDCGCFNDANYGFMSPVRFEAKDESGLEKKLQELKRTASSSSNGDVCVSDTPAEILIFDRRYNIVKRWSKRQEMTNHSV